MKQQDLESFISELRPVKTLKQGLVLFAQVEMPARNLARRTREEYRADLEDLVAFLEERGVVKLSEVGLYELRLFQAEMDRRGYAASTRERKIYAIKALFSFLHRYGFVSRDVAAELIPPKRRRREPRFLTQEEYGRLRKACADHPRDRAIIELLLQTGMRLSELAGLALSDVELPERITRDPDQVGTVWVTRSTGGTDPLSLNYKACRAVKAWLAERSDVDHEALFVNRFKDPMSARAIQQAVKKYMDKAGIEDASVRTLRHTMATHHVVQGTDLETLKDILGHEQLETTKIYQRLARKAQRQAVQEHAL